MVLGGLVLVLEQGLAPGLELVLEQGPAPGLELGPGPGLEQGLGLVGHRHSILGPTPITVI